MGETNARHHKAIPLQTIIIVMIAVGTIISSFLMYFMYKTSKSYEGMRSATQNYIDCQEVAAELRADSENLTIRARSFVVTGEAEQAILYYSEAQNGSAQGGFLEELEAYALDDKARNQLNTAMQLRARMMVTEGYAMRLMVAAIEDDITNYPMQLQVITLLPDDTRLSSDEKMEKARSLLFDSNYESSRNEVVTKINQGLDVLMSTMLAEQMSSAQLLQTGLFRQQALSVALMAALLVLAVFTFSMVILPLRRQIAGMTNEQLLNEEGASEIQFLARTYNRLYEQNQRANDDLKFEATHDALTGLYNRTAYESAMKEELAQSGEKVSLILADVDHFKDINDQHGHDVGDVTLKTVADTLTASFRREDMVCRIGGDEFAVIMRNVDSGFKALVQNKMRQVAGKLSSPEGGMPPVTLSVGVAFSDQKSEDMDLFKRADTALYHIKNGGRNGCGFFNASGEIEVVHGAPEE